MLGSVSRSRSLWAAKVLAASVVALTAAGCSSGVERFSYNPFENPFAGRSNNEPTATGSIARPQPGIAAPSSSVTAQPLPPAGAAPQVTYQPTYQPPAAAAPVPQYQPPQQQTYTPPAQPSYQPPQAAAPQAGMPRAAAPSASGWTLEGGSSLTVQQGTTAQTLSKRYGVPAAVILSTNGLPPNAQLQPGQRVTIPVYRAGPGGAAPRQSEAPPAAPPAAPAVASAAPTLAPGPGFLKAPSAGLQTAQAPAPKAAAMPAKGGTYTVQPGDTLNSIARKHNTTAAALASANGVEGDHKVRLGETLKLPGAGTPAVAAKAAPAPAAAAPVKPVQTAAVAQPAAKPAAAPAAQPAQAVAKPAVAQASAPAQAQPAATVQKAVAKPETAAAAADDEETTGSTGEGSLRWPVRGRVISGFGSKPNGTTNDGINLAVPEGTPVKAADGGVVAYAGNELKGYGNLVLVRHPNGYVTAYAHNSEILVKKGDIIRRGQVISKAGKSGNVSSPQLHFEVRKGATPVDPMQHLPNS